MFRKLKQRLHLSRSHQSPKHTKARPIIDQKHNDNTLHYVIAPLSEILSSIGDSKTDVELNPMRRELFELEALLSSIIDSHHHGDGNMKGEGELPRYEEIYKQGTTIALVSSPVPPVQALSPEAPTLKRKPHGLLQRLPTAEEKSSREMALEALTRLLSASALIEEKPRSRPIFPEETRLGAARRRAMEGLAQRGWDMRQVIPRGRTKTRELEEERYGRGYGKETSVSVGVAA